MKRILLLLTVWHFFILSGCAQTKPADRPHCIDKAFDQKVSNMISFSVPTIGVSELRDIQDEVYIFDTRKKEEYEVSHLPNARYLGYEDYDVERLTNVPKNSKIVLYCSIGYRSEKIGEKLVSEGYTKVYNLYGSIFEWVNQGNPIVNQNNQPTQKVHTYNRQWSKWLDGKKAEKVW